MDTRSRRFLRVCILIAAGMLLPAFQVGAQTIITPEAASFEEHLAAREVRRYIYLRTDRLLEIQATDELPASGDVILVANQGNAMVADLRHQINQTAPAGGTILKTIRSRGREVLVVTGSDPGATLHAAYRFAEHLGVGFDLAGDAIPDAKIPLRIDGFDEVGVPRFETRGVLPFHDFYAGPDIWQTDDYLIAIGQLAKMGMNFIGLHTYHNERGHFSFKGVEPTTWIGLPEDVNPDGTVEFSYPTWYAHSHRPDEIWSSESRGTSYYHAGAREIFPRHFYGSDVYGNSYPTDMAGYNQVFNRVGRMFDEAFTFAENIGVQTALGTELGMTNRDWLPRNVLNRVGGSVRDTELMDLYRGMFTRVMNAHPLDYFWLWTWEVYQDEEASASQDEEYRRELRLAYEALQEVGAPFSLGMAGWKLGGVTPDTFDDPSLLPNSVPFLSLWDAAEGHDSLSHNRTKWAATWFEEDGAMIHPRPEVERIYFDIEGALKNGSDGVIAKHWRTRAVGMNSHAMRDLLWTYGRTGSRVDQSLPDFDEWRDAVYLDWATRQFGPEVSRGVAEIFQEIDGWGSYPLVASWSPEPDFGPGVIIDDPDLEDFSFVSEMERLRSRVRGAGNLERFDYWLKDMQSWELMDQYGVAKSQDDRAAMADLFEQIVSLEIEGLTNASDLGEIMHLENMTWYKTEVVRGGHTGSPQPGRAYTGEPFIRAVPARTQLGSGESLTLNVVALGVATPTLRYRTLGSERWTALDLTRVRNSVYSVTIPAQNDDFEYYMESGNLVFPVTAPNMYQTVVVTAPKE